MGTGTGGPIGVELLRAPAEIDEATLRPLAERFPGLEDAHLRAGGSVCRACVSIRMYTPISVF